MKGIIENRKSSNQGALIKDLNPIIRGWRNYYRAVVSADIFHKIDDWLFKKIDELDEEKIWEQEP